MWTACSSRLRSVAYPSSHTELAILLFVVWMESFHKQQNMYIFAHWLLFIRQWLDNSAIVADVNKTGILSHWGLLTSIVAELLLQDLIEHW